MQYLIENDQSIKQRLGTYK